MDFILWLITFFVLISIIEQQSKFHQKVMATFQDFKDKLAEIATATDNIADDIQRLSERIADGGISAVEQGELLETLTSAASKLKLVASIVPEPEPAPEEPPTEG